MKMNRTTLTLIVASLCGVGSYAVGQESPGQLGRSTAGRVGDLSTKEVQSGASQSISDAGEVTAPAVAGSANRTMAGATRGGYPVAMNTPATVAPRVAGRGTDCTSPGCTSMGGSGLGSGLGSSCGNSGCTDCGGMGGGNNRALFAKACGGGIGGGSGTCCPKIGRAHV